MSTFQRDSVCGSPEEKHQIPLSRAPLRARVRIQTLAGSCFWNTFILGSSRICVSFRPPQNQTKSTCCIDDLYILELNLVTHNCSYQSWEETITDPQPQLRHPNTHVTMTLNRLELVISVRLSESDMFQTKTLWGSISDLKTETLDEIKPSF